MRELEKTYDPKAVESKIYQMWMDGGYFKGVIDPEKKPFTIVIPPPNVTGELHLGHAFDETIQDIIIRARRMQGYAALWVPGTDHAGIATQVKVEEQLKKEGKTRFDLGRDAFIERVWEWKEKYGSKITEQLKTLGSSCDWDRERFTMDEGCSRAVREVFVSLYEKDLIYKGKRIINWCPDCETALSDAEVEHQEYEGDLYYLKYPIKDSEEYLVVATTRPETMLGDTGVAIHPEDTRFRHLLGKTAILPLVGRELPIVADDVVEMEFGTGCVKMTPAHDAEDFLIGQRHGLEQVLIFDGLARVNENGGKYQGMDRFDARNAVLEDLVAQGSLLKKEPYRRNVGTCYRCTTIIETMISPQWFVKMAPLTVDALRVVETGEIKFIPERFVKVYRNWMENAHDWCISRQLWWGHQIPAWNCEACSHITVSRDDPTVCEACQSPKIVREEDVLDTWFSSGLWPFSVFNWPDKTPDIEYFYPTSVLVTGYDILFFWVARMIFSGLEQMGEIPFHTVLLHGLIRDADGRKMSKTMGNGVDPIDVINTYGADALRFNIITGNSPGNDVRYYHERCEAMRNFANKIWNASRFVMMNLEGDEKGLPETLELEDKWILSNLNQVAKEVNENLEKYELGIAAGKIYDFIWDTFCDWYIELSKPRLNGEDEQAKRSARQVLLFVLGETLKLLHPYMPFITEEIWQALPVEGEAIMVESYPTWRADLHFPEEEARFEKIMAAVRAIRGRRSEMKVPPSKKSKALIVTEDEETFEAGRVYFGKLAYVSDLTITKKAPEREKGQVTVVTRDARIFLPLAELVDLDAERARIEKELGSARENLDRILKKLLNENFRQKAKESVVEAEEEKAKQAQALIRNLEESLKQLGE